jgi:DNA polymerase III subunit delta
MTFEQLASAFRKRQFEPLYLLYGEERFLIEEAQRVLLEHALQPHEKDFNLDIVYGAEADAQDVLSLCTGYPMMAERRVVLVRDFDKLKNNRLFQSYAQSPNPSAVVMLVCTGKPNMAQHPYRALREAGAAIEMKPLNETKLAGWIEERASGYGYRIEHGAVQMLIENVGRDLKAGVGELEKLITYVGERREIVQEDVIRASGRTREYNVFELQKAVGEMRYADASRIAGRMLQQASNPTGEALMIVTVLSGYFVKLWKLTALKAKGASEREMASGIGVPPYYLKEYLFGLKRHGPDAIAGAFVPLLAADFELKGGSTRDERLVLALLLRSLIPASGSGKQHTVRTGRTAVS